MKKTEFSKAKKMYLPMRFVFAVMIIILKTAALAAAICILGMNVPYFRFVVRIAAFGFVLKIVSSADNPEYKIPWLLIITAMPGVGSLLYLMFYSRLLPVRYIKRLEKLLSISDFSDDFNYELALLKEKDAVAEGQARLLCSLSGSHVYADTKVKYYSVGKEMFTSLLNDIAESRCFVYLEYYIIECGEVWNKIFSSLCERAAHGVDVRILFDDIGCIRTLPKKFTSQMARFGIYAIPFSQLHGSADSEFNNRNHRKIAVIDGTVAYTGGINIADEYAGLELDFVKWKDSAVRLEGAGARELYRLFILDYYLNSKDTHTPVIYLPDHSIKGAPTASRKVYKRTGRASFAADEQNSDIATGFCIPFGDGPRPLYSSRVSKSIITAMLGSAVKSMYITTPYLIIDSELLCAIENCAERGVNIKIVLPEIPDKKIIYLVSMSFLPRLIDAGVEVYLYTDGFIHAKTYIQDGKYALVGTMNLDNRSLSHNFECGVWMYGGACIGEILKDSRETLLSSRRIYKNTVKSSWYKKIFCAILKFFSPLL